MKYLQFLAAITAASAFPAALANLPKIENSANFVPIQAAVAALGGAANGIEARDTLKNSANFVPIQATIAAASEVVNGISAEKRHDFDYDHDSIENSANFIPIEATVAALAGAVNGVKAKRDIDNSANFVPVQAAVAALGGVSNSIESGQDEFQKHAEEHGYDWKRNEILSRSPLLDGLKTNVAGEDLLRQAVKRYADEYDAEMAKREVSQDGRGQRPRPRTESIDGEGMCSVGKIQCCNQMIKDESSKEALGVLAGVNDVISGAIGLNCNSIPIIGATLQNQCKSSPVCCQNVTQNGLINFGCISLPIN